MVRKKYIPPPQPIPTHDIPKPADFSDGAITKAKLRQSLRQPLVSLPVVGVVVVGAFAAGTALLTPAISIPALIIAGACAATSVVSWIFNFGVRGKRYETKYVEELTEKRKAYMESQAQMIQYELQNSDFDEGITTVTKLTEAYTKLKSFLENLIQADPSNHMLTRFVVLTEETYTKGVELLRNALVLYKALNQVDAEALQVDLADFDRDKKLLEKNPTDLNKIKIDALAEKIKGYQSRLAVIADTNKELQKRMVMCDHLVQELESSYLKVAALVTSGDKTSLDSAAESLEANVNAALHVEAMLKGPDHSAQDAMFEKAGLDAQKEKNNN